MATREHVCYVQIECFDNEDGLLKLLGLVNIRFCAYLNEIQRPT
jgi:hypothetical protein